MVHTTQTMSGDSSIIDLRSAETSAPGGTATAAIGGNGFRPAVQARYELDAKPVGNEKVTGTASVTATLGQGISASAYTMYEINDGKSQTRLGLSAEYNQRSGASVAVGGRYDYNTGGPVNPYASAIASTSGRSGIEVGGCTDVTVAGQTGSVCAGINRSSQSGTSFVIGLGKTF